MTPFEFLRTDFPELHRGAVMAGAAALRDPRTSCFYARWTIEQAIVWAYAHDRSLPRPYDNGVSALLHEPAFRNQLGDEVFRQAKEVIRLGNRAVHDARQPTDRESVTAVSHLFQFCFWFARTYGSTKPGTGLRFDPRSLPGVAPRPAAAPPTTAAPTTTAAPDAAATASTSAAPAADEPAPATAAQIQQLEAQLEQERRAREAEATGRADLEAELERLRAEVAAAKALALAIPDTHDYSEAETRDFFIDRLLAEAGWTLDQPRDREFPVTGMPTAEGGDGTGKVDYVLWGADGRPLALVEAKRTRRSPQAGQQQAKLYADCLEQMFGQRPVIYYTNGYEHWLWDDTTAPPRQVQGFRTRDELELAIQRRTTRSSLAAIEIDGGIVGRYYQSRSIRRVAESFERDHARRALVVMATGAGKTRTVIALADLLIRANWAKRVLFLADRTALVRQAVNAFKAHLPDANPVNLVTDRHGEGRVYVSTYPTMLNLIDEPDGRRRFGPGHFDLVVIDEAHRSVFNKYGAIFEYFDSLLVGLTATPREEIDRNTYRLFDLEDGVPTDNYGLDEAVADGFLVPMRAVSVPLKFQREGIRYDDLSDDERDQWDALEWDDDVPPDEVGAEAMNRWLFNADTVDKVLAHVMTHGQKVEGGDRLGKTIVFAKNQRHAEFIAQRFDAQYPQYRGDFARIITHATEYAQDLIDKFSIPAQPPHLAISVDMLDTGIDVPEVVNLVFFKLVRSTTKFWQMIGRGTRLCPDLFGPGRDKEFFSVFDFCQNLEFFNQNPPEFGGSTAPSLSARLFGIRLDLVGALDAAGPVGSHLAMRADIADLLRAEVAAMNVDNVAVRAQRRLVERFSEPDAWTELDVAARAELAARVAGLPTQTEPEPEMAKRFDLLVLSTELALLRTQPGYPRLQQQIREIAGLLEGYPTIPAIARELELIADVQTDAWWTDVTLSMLEQMRRRLRLLVPFIERHRREPVYADFEDEIGEGVEVDLGGLAATGDMERFRRKTRQFVSEHQGHAVLEKIRHNWPITEADLAELERVLIEAGVGTNTDVERAAAEAGSFGLFMRQLVGLDRAAAKELFVDFLDTERYSAYQIEFVSMVVDELTEHGIVTPRRFYESPFTDIAPLGPDALFEASDVERLIAKVAEVRRGAEAA